MTVEDFRNQFFADTERRTLTLDITSEDWAGLCQVIEENEWEQDEGLRYILAAGRAYIQTAALVTSPDDLSADERAGGLQRFQREIVEMRSQFAVMRYRAFYFMQAVQLLEMKLNACESQKNLLRQANERLRQKPPDGQP
ncbi:MAG: hypothetical protein JW963_11460 [Anaerolineales bacterium]|nr:hypothetical protein [Anaerolineales bacterium]